MRRTSHETRDRDQRAHQATPPGQLRLSSSAVSVPGGRMSALIRPDSTSRSTLLRGLTGWPARPRGPPPRCSGPAARGSGLPGGDRLPGPGDPAVLAADRRRAHGIGATSTPAGTDSSVRERLAGLKIPLDRPVDTLSGGQRAQLALALTLAKRPRLLLLDEPLAALDPLARRDFLAALAEAAAGGDLTIVLSSHLIADIERPATT